MPISLCKLIFALLLSLQLHAYNFSAIVDNTHPMLGEQTTLTLTFSYDDLEEYEIEEPVFAYGNLALLEDSEIQESNGTWVATLRYVLTPLKAGTLTLPALHTTLEKIHPQYQDRYNRNKYLEKITLISKPITLHVSPLPKGISVTGEYQLHTTVNRDKVLAGKPTLFTLTLTGEGNINSLDFITLHIPHTTIYELNTANNTKSFSIISDRNYTIPPITLKYFNQSSKEVEMIRSDAIDITVEGGKDRSISAIISKNTLLSLLIIGFMLLGIYLYRFFDKLAYIDEKKYFIAQLKKCKNKEELLKKVVPYMHENRRLARLIYRLEVCEVGEFRGLKKEIINYFHH